MPNRTLSKDELDKLYRPLWHEILFLIGKAAAGDNELRFALNRKICKELSYLERGKPSVRRDIKLKKYAQQKGICPECGKELPEFGKNADLDRKSAIAGYTLENTELVHNECHRKRQASRNYS
jgi:hypothetical protein